MNKRAKLFGFGMLFIAFIIASQATTIRVNSESDAINALQGTAIQNLDYCKITSLEKIVESIEQINTTQVRITFFLKYTIEGIKQSAKQGRAYSNSSLDKDVKPALEKACNELWIQLQNEEKTIIIEYPSNLINAKYDLATRNWLIKGEQLNE